jgi:YihY family inner membrane protein
MSSTSENELEPQASEPDTPLEQVEAELPQAGWWPQTRALVVFMSGTEVHTYAFSVAANVILALFPFIVMMLTIAQQVFHSQTMVDVLTELMKNLLPTNQAFVMNNMKLLSHPHKGTQLFSVVMLLITTTGVFLPLEVALNDVWGVKKHRNYLANQLVSLGLAVAVGVLVLASVALSAGQKTLFGWLFLGHTDNFFFQLVSRSLLEILASVAGILIFFLVYWLLPNRKIPARAVLPTAIVVGLAWEAAKYLYVLVLPRLDFESVYGPFRVSVGIMMWAFLSGLMLLAGAHVSATRYTLKLARERVG